MVKTICTVIEPVCCYHILCDFCIFHFRVFVKVRNVGFLFRTGLLRPKNVTEYTILSYSYHFASDVKEVANIYKCAIVQSVQHRLN